MIPKLQLKVLPQYFQWIASGLKTVEGRLKQPKLAQLQPGDTIQFLTDSTRTINAQVTYTKVYKSFKEMLLDQGIQKCLPDVSDIEEGVKIYHSFPGYREKESKIGVLAIGLGKRL